MTNKSSKELCEESKTFKMSDENKISGYGFGVRHIQMACMFLSLTVMLMARSNISIAVLAMTDRHRANDTNVLTFSWSETSQGLILSSFFWSYLVMQIPSGLLAKRLGGKPLMMIALMANGILCLLTPILVQWGDWPILCLVRVGMGLTQACLFPCSHTLLSRWLPAHERTTYLGIVYGGSKLGIIIGLSLGGVLADSSMGWKSIFYTSGATLLVTSAVWWYYTASGPCEHWMIKEEEKAFIEKGLTDLKTLKTLQVPWREIFTSSGFWAIVCAHCGFVVYYYVFFMDVPKYMDKVLHISIKSSAGLSALPYIGMWLSSAGIATLSDRLVNANYLSLKLSRKLANSISHFGVAAGLIAMCFVRPEDKFIAVVILVGSLSCGGAFVAGFMGSSLDMSPNFGGLLMACSNGFGNLFGAVVPIFTRSLLQDNSTDIHRWRIVFIAIAAFLIITNIIYILFGTDKKQSWDNPNLSESKDVVIDELQPALEKQKQHQKTVE